jgi:hypothetical protein
VTAAFTAALLLSAAVGIPAASSTNAAPHWLMTGGGFVDL